MPGTRDPQNDNNRRNVGKFEAIDPTEDYEGETEPVGETSPTKEVQEVPENLEEHLEETAEGLFEEIDSAVDSAFDDVIEHTKKLGDDTIEINESDIEFLGEAEAELKEIQQQTEERINDAIEYTGDSEVMKGTAVETPSNNKNSTNKEAQLEEKERNSGKKIDMMEITLENGIDRELPKKIKVGEKNLDQPKELDAGGMKEIFSYEEETGEKKAVAFSKGDELEFSLDEAIALNKLSEVEDIINLEDVFVIDESNNRHDIDIEELENKGTEKYIEANNITESSQVVMIEDYVEGRDLSKERVNLLSDREEKNIEQSANREAMKILNESGIEGLKNKLKEKIVERYDLNSDKAENFFNSKLELKKEKYSEVGEEEILIKMFRKDSIVEKMSDKENFEDLDRNIEYFEKAADQLSQIHEKEVTHNDIKAANIIEGNIIDFGMSEMQNRIAKRDSLVSGSKRNKEAAALFWKDDMDEKNLKDKDTRALILTAFDKLVSEPLKVDKMNDLIGEGDYKGTMPPSDPADSVKPYQDLAFHLLKEIDVPNEVLGSISHASTAEESRNIKPDIESAWSNFKEWHDGLMESSEKIEALDEIMDYLGNPDKMKSLLEEDEKGNKSLTKEAQKLIENISSLSKEENMENLTFDQISNNAENILTQLKEKNKNET